MRGLKVTYYCPVCKETKHITLTGTCYMKVKDKSMVNLRCADCNTELFVEVVDDYRNLVDGRADKSRDRFSELVDKIISENDYSDKTREEIVYDVLNKLSKMTSEISVSLHSFSIRKYIDMRLNRETYGESYTPTSYVVDNDKDKLPDIDKKYIFKKKDAKFDCSIFY